MSKNAIHNFNLSIKNSADIKSSEYLTEAIIKELAKVSKEINQQKDIEQLWQEQKALNAVANNSSTSIGEGATNTNVGINEKQLVSVSNTSSVSEGTKANHIVSAGEGINGASKLFGNTSSVAETTTSGSNASIGEGVADTTGGPIMSSAESANITSPIPGAENNANSNSIMSQTYASVAAQQTLTVPQTLQAGIDEPSIEIIKEEIKKKLDQATAINDIVGRDYWTNISKAFTEGYTVKDFDGKPEHALFTQMYAALKQANQVVTVQNFSWDIIRQKMIESIDANILNGKISEESKKRWELIKQKLNDDKINIANLFEQYDELFLLLKEVEGLNSLPTTITITTKTKIYPNLSADRVYPPIGKEAVYVFLKEISDIYGSEVNKGAVKISNAEGSSFIVGENLEFMLNETFIKDKGLQKRDINWIVYHVEKKESSIFRDKGTSLNYNFDQAGTYRIDAYGKSATIKQKKNLDTATFIELNIVKQHILITSSVITKDGLTRTSTKEKSFKVALKNPKVKTLNPLKLYYQVESKTANKVNIISEEQELDSTGIVKFPTPNLGEYLIKVISKDQYALNLDYKFNAIKNEVNDIGQVKNASNKGVFLVGDPNNKLTLEAKNFRINPATDEEKEDVKWIIYDANNKPYLPPGSVVMADNDNPKKRHLHKWSYFDVPLPKKEGNYTVEAYSDTMQGVKAKSVFNIEMTRPQITKAYWASGGGSKKQVSGFEGESNWVKADIPYYNNQTVRIYFYLGKTKTKYYCDVKTNKNGEIFKEIKFDSDFKKLIGFQKGNNAKIGFKLLGIQNGKPYPFKSPANYESDTVLSVTTEVKILDAYFMYDGRRVESQDEVPFNEKGTIITIVAKIQNMVGKEIVLTAHKVGEEPIYRNTATVNSEGVAITRFLLRNLNKKLKNGTVNKYYVGIEGYSTKHLTDKMINMVVGVSSKNKVDTGVYNSHFDENMIHIFDVEKGYADDENDRGGKTNRGITYRTYESFYHTYKPKITPTEEKHKNLSFDEAKNIYKVEFWNKIHGDEIYNASVALYIFDFAINSGVYNAAKVVQETLKNDFRINISTDGTFGTGTLNSLNRVDFKEFYKKLDKNRRKFVDDIIKNHPSQKEYKDGWENRLNKLEYKEEEYSIRQKIENWLRKEYKQSPIKDKNSSIANLILEAHALNLVEFNSEGKIGAFDSGLGGTQDTFIKIRDGLEIGNGLGNAVPKHKFDPTSENIPIIEKALKIIQSNVQNWVNNNYIPKEPDKLKLGSFMVWNTSSDGIAGALRGSSHGNKASAIDFNLSTFSNVKISFNTSNAEKMVLDIIKSLPKADYGFGLPVQGNFFSDFNGLSMKKSIYNGEYNKAYTRLKSEAIKEEIEKRMKDNKILVFPDNPDHLHIQLLKEV